MLLAFADPAAPGEGRKQCLVDMQVERRELQPLVQVSERLLVADAAGEMLEQSGVAGPESPPLGGEPAAEDRAAIDFEACQKISIEQRQKTALPFGSECLDALPRPRG